MEQNLKHINEIAIKHQIPSYIRQRNKNQKKTFRKDHAFRIARERIDDCLVYITQGVSFLEKRLKKQIRLPENIIILFATLVFFNAKKNAFLGTIFSVFSRIGKHAFLTTVLA